MSLDNIFSGFEKKAAKAITFVGAAIGAMGGSLTGAGTGFLAKAKFEDKLKPKAQRTNEEELLAKSPLYGFLGGAALGAISGGLQYRKHYGKPFDRAAKTMGEMFKEAALKKNVILRDHQERALAKADENNGNLLVAHATGSGKTLTGIAAFEKEKSKDKGKKAIVVVPAGLRENFAENGVKKFTDSSVVLYGPKAEKKSKNVGDKSNADYNVVSYELFREHGEKLLEDTGADTLIMDEIHRVRGTEGRTYNKIRDLRPKFKNAITLTGSIVNNNPNDVVPLLDITYRPDGHKLVSKKFFDKLFVRPEAKTYGLFNPKVHVEKKLKNKDQLNKYISGKVDFISHKDLEKDLPNKITEKVEVEMSDKQQALYDYTMTSVDPITRWKIKNNIPVGQREAKDAFSKLLQARQVATDPAVLDKELRNKNPMEYSNKIRKIVTDTKKHLGDSGDNRTVIYSNLIKGQLDGIEKALKSENVDYTKFVGVGQPGSTVKTRTQAIKDFNANKKRVLLLSGAGAEGLDLKNATMMQMVEGHYNPERIQQAEARVRRMGAFAHLPEEKRKVIIKRYVSKPKPTTTGKVMGAVGLKGGDQGVDEWIYNIANKKDDLNSEFRDVLKKKASAFTSEQEAQADLEALGGKMRMQTLGSLIGSIPGDFLAKRVAKRTDAKVDEKIKQRLLDKQKEELVGKRHYKRILAESKLDERALDASVGTSLVAGGLGILAAASPGGRKLMKDQGNKLLAKLTKERDSIKKMDDAIGRMYPKKWLEEIPFPASDLGKVTRWGATGVASGMLMPSARELLRQRVITGSIDADKNLDEGIKRYEDKLRKKMERKYKGSKAFIQEYDVKKELGIDVIT